MKHEFDHDFFREIAKYNTEVFIQAFSNVNMKVFKHQIETDNPFFTVKLSDVGINSSKQFHLCHWTVRDVIFQKIRRSFDCKLLKTTITDAECVNILGLYNDYENELSKSRTRNKDIFYVMFGISENQFRSQTNVYRIDKKRNQIIFKELYEEGEQFFDFDRVINDALGMSHNEFRFIIISIVVMAVSQGVVNLLDYEEDKFQYVEGIDNFKEKYNRVIDYYSVKKEDLNSTSLLVAKYRYLFAQHNIKNVLIDSFMLQEKFADAEIWIARDFYKKNEKEFGKEYFPNQYGILFERYLEYAAKQEGVEKKLFNVNIPENLDRFFTTRKGYKVDYVLETDNCRLIIECKSGIKSVGVKDTYDNVNALNDFLKRTFDKGAEQVHNAILNSRKTDKELVGIVVHSEKSFMKTRLKFEHLEVEKKELFKIIIFFDIHDFEFFINLLKRDPLAADEVLLEYGKTQFEGDFADFPTVMEKKYELLSFLDDKEIIEDEDFTRFMTEEAMSKRNKM